jgi:hypothetical protein
MGGGGGKSLTDESAGATMVSPTVQSCDLLERKVEQPTNAPNPIISMGANTRLFLVIAAIFTPQFTKTAHMKSTLPATGIFSRKKFLGWAPNSLPRNGFGG